MRERSSHAGNVTTSEEYMNERSTHVRNLIMRRILRVITRHTRINIIRLEKYNHRLINKPSQKRLWSQSKPNCYASWYVRSLYTQNQLPRKLLWCYSGAAGQILDILKLRLTQPQVKLELGLSLAKRKRESGYF